MRLARGEEFVARVEEDRVRAQLPSVCFRLFLSERATGRHAALVEVKFVPQRLWDELCPDLNAFLRARCHGKTVKGAGGEQKAAEAMALDFAYWVDKPMVTWALVEDEFRGRGVGQVAYKAMARWLAEEHALPLFGGPAPDPKAMGMWQRMKDAGEPVSIEGRRPRLDYR